jgi:nucleoside-diphosphate-sugar epimerase
MRFGKVLVTGAGGLLGGYVARELAGKTRIAGLDIASPADAKSIGTFTKGAIEDPAAVTAAMRGQDAVVHIAARPNIWSGQGDEIVHTNVTGTWNVLQAAEEAGVKRVILTSSDSVIGYTVLQGTMLPPDYLPVDEAHPRRPTDAYANSKKLCEELGRSFAARGKLEVVVLRPVYVLYPEFEGEVRARAANPTTYKGPEAGGRQPAGGGVMWHYVDPRDLARAYRLALEADKPGFGPYFICGRTTLAPEPTIERLAARMGRRIPVKRPEVYEKNPHAPLYDLTLAEQQLDFVAEHDMRRLLYPGK